MAQAIPLIALAVTAASTGYQINAANSAADKADEAAKQQKVAQDQAVSDQQSQAKQMKDDQAQATANATAQATSASQSSQGKAANALAAGGSRNDTILTSPLGLSSAPAQGGAKTLLGA